MSSSRVLAVSCLAVLLLSSGCARTTAVNTAPDQAADTSWRDEFGVSQRDLATTGHARYFVLEPGFSITLESDDEVVTITVLDETEEVDGVTTRVVEEREWEDDQLAEVSRNFVAICRKTGDVFYFGEDVLVYRNGKAVKGKDGWRAGEKDCRPGLLMPGAPSVGMRYYQEIAPGTAMDRAEVVGLTESLKTPAGTFTDCLKTMEGTALDPAEKEYKTYAPGIGIIQDGDCLLTRYGFGSEK